MVFQSLAIAIISCFLWIFSWLYTPTALALTPIKISNLSYAECSAELSEGNVGSGDVKPAKCFIISGKAENQSGKDVVDADVFGRIYDANGNNIMENRGRIGTITSVPMGVSDFEIRISVPANQPTPLQLKQFKASGFGVAVRPYYYNNEDGELF
jgi:hypothetical protein